MDIIETTCRRTQELILWNDVMVTPISSGLCTNMDIILSISKNKHKNRLAVYTILYHSYNKQCGS